MSTSRTNTLLLVAAISTLTAAACSDDSAGTREAPASSAASEVSTLATDPTTSTAAPDTTESSEVGTTDAPMTVETVVEEEPTTTAAPVLPPDPLPVGEGLTAVGILRWNLDDVFRQCVYLEFADGKRATFEALGFDTGPYNADGTDEASVTMNGVTMWTGTSVVVGVKKTFPHEDGMGQCSGQFDQFLIVETMQPT